MVLIFLIEVPSILDYSATGVPPPFFVVDGIIAKKSPLSARKTL
jgi:hypothetical protein